MNYELINSVCYYVCMSSIGVGATLGLASIWITGLWESEFAQKSWLTMGVLFVSSALGAIVTKLLVIR